MRFLICPGMARAGTTLLWQQLCNNGELFNFSRKQELRYLSHRKVSFPEYMDQFSSTDPAKIFLDVSPVYLYRANVVLKNLRSLLAGNEVRFVLNIRSPVEQAFSLYLMRIRNHIARSYAESESGASNPLIFDTDAYFSNPQLQIAAFVEGVIEHFGRESIAFIDIGREFGTPEPAVKLENLLQVRLAPFDFSKRVNRGSNALPWYIYGGPDGSTFEWEGLSAAVDPRTLVLVSARRQTRSWQDVDPELAARALNGAALWTRFVGRERVEDLFNRHFADQWRRISDLLGYDFIGSIVHKDLGPAPSFPPDFLRRVSGVRTDKLIGSQPESAAGGEMRVRRRR